jgi:hypothetical protein
MPIEPHPNIVISRAREHADEYYSKAGETELEAAIAKLEADARALWAYRVFQRNDLNDPFGREPDMIKRAEALVAEDPSLGEGL